MLLIPTWKLRMFAAVKIPLLAMCRPRVMEMNDQRCVMEIPLTRVTKNHWNSMYFGAIAVGADAAAGLAALYWMKKSGVKISFLFKASSGEFLKRIEGTARFTCEAPQVLEQLVRKVVDTGERHHAEVPVVVTCPKKSGDEPVARFTMTVSLKKSN